MGDTPRRRMRSAHVAIGVTAIAAATLTGCSSSPDYAAVCIDEQTQQRISDYECDDDGSYSSGSHVWYYLGSSRRVPTLGSRVYGGSTSEPSGSSVQRGGLPTTGGSSVGSSVSSSSGGSSDYGGSSSGSSGSSDYGGFGGSSGHVSS